MIHSSKLDKSFDNFTIVFFSDLHFGMIEDELFYKSLETINDFQPDLILFGGDLVDHYSRAPLNDEDRQKLTDGLTSLNARFGKFAVLGNHDLDSENTKNAITNVLYDAGFEIITNKNINIYNDSNEAFKLIGIDSLSLGSPDVTQAFEGVEETTFNLSLCHTPDIFDEIPNISDYLLAGHSHGGQIYFPFITSLYVPYGSKKYYHGKYHHNNTTLDITNGVGFTNKTIRLNADGEVVVYKLKSK